MERRAFLKLLGPGAAVAAGTYVVLKNWPKIQELLTFEPVMEQYPVDDAFREGDAYTVQKTTSTGEMKKINYFVGSLDSFNNQLDEKDIEKFVEKFGPDNFKGLSPYGEYLKVFYDLGSGEKGFARVLKNKKSNIFHREEYVEIHLPPRLSR